MALLDQIKSYFDQLKPETNLTLPGGFSGFGQSLSNYFTPDNLKSAFQPKEKKGFFQRAKEKITSFFTPEVRKEIPGALKETSIKFAKALPETFAPALTNFAKTTGGIIGEGLAYAIDPNVREQYKAGKTDILPKITATSLKDLSKDTLAAGLEAAVYKFIPQTAKMQIQNRFGVGALQGLGFAVAQGLAQDQTVEQIKENAKTYGVLGGAIEIVAPYLLPLLKTELKNIPTEVKNAFKGLSKEAAEAPVGLSIKATDEFKVGDVLDPQGKTNMVGRITIREVKGNTLKFVDSEGTEFAGMQRSQVRKLVEGGSWNRVAIPEGEPRVPKPEISPDPQPLAQEARKYKSAEEFVSQVRQDLTIREVGMGEVGVAGRGEIAVPRSVQRAFDKSLAGRLQAAKIRTNDKSQLTDFYNQAVKPTAPTPPSGAIPPKPPIKPPTLPEPQIPEAKETISKLIKAIDEAVPLRSEQKKLYAEEMAKRTARVAAAGEKVPGEAGFFAQLGQLKGPLPKAQFEAVRKLFSQTEVDLLFNSVEQTKTLLPLEKVSTKEGLRKLFEGAVPTPSEIAHLREVFPKELIDSILARRPVLDKFKDAFGEVWNLSRTMMATLDLSAPFRQGVFMLGRPIRFAQAFKDMFKFAVSEKAYVGLMDGIKARPTYLKMKQGKLALTEIGGPLLKREERFMSNLAEKIPGYGALVRASNRAYTGFLNKLRADIFDDILRKAEVVGRDVDEPLLQSIADFVNAGTGRGKFGFAETGIIPKSMERAAVVLNGAFFSPRLMASRLNLLNPYFYVHLDPLVRKEAIKTLFGTAGILGSIYGLWKLNGGEVGIDPRSADFGKLKLGNTRYDILGGFQQYVKLAAQLITGEVVSSTTGRTITLGEGYKPLTRKEIVLRFFENKTSPIASFLIGLMTGQTATGEDVDVPTEIINRFLPMVVQDLYDISQEKGAEGLLYGLPAIFGTGVQTYGQQELVVGESRLGEETAQVRPVPELAEKIRELVMGQIPLGASKSFSIETYFDQLSNLPKEQAADIFDQISKTNPDLAKQIIKVVKEREKGITVKDKDLKAKGVASGDRSLAVKKELDRLKTPEEKAALWDDYVRKGIITKKVSEQLTNLLQ